MEPGWFLDTHRLLGFFLVFSFLDRQLTQSRLLFGLSRFWLVYFAFGRVSFTLWHCAVRDLGSLSGR